MNSHRKAKNEQLTRLAKQAKMGVIVELGTFRGEGTIALSMGAKVPIYTIDDYRSKKGWAGERYSIKDRKLFFDLANEHAHLIQGDVREVALSWQKSISLLVWDLGVAKRLQGDFIAWEKFVQGKFLIHDTEDQQLGSKELNPDGWRKYKDGVFWVLERL